MLCTFVKIVNIIHFFFLQIYTKQYLSFFFFVYLACKLHRKLQCKQRIFLSKKTKKNIQRCEM